MHVFRLTFLCFITWLLVAFLPAHTRGRITMTPTAHEDECCAPVVVEPTDCCAGPTTTAEQVGKKQHKPTPRERANCAVCFWAAGLLATPPVFFEQSFAERAFEMARAYDAQVRRAALRLNHHGRDPPTRLPASIVL